MRVALTVSDRTESAGLARQLREHGHGCLEFATADALRRALRRESFDLLLLSATLPDGSGASLLETVRAGPDPIPVILIRDAEADPQADPAGDAGPAADHSLVRPVDQTQLAAAVSRLLAQRYGNGPVGTIESIAGHQFDHQNLAVRWDEVGVMLTAKEFGLALLLFRNLGRPLSRAHIMETVWGRIPDTASRTLDAHVSQIRRRLQLLPSRGFRLTSIYGFGYVLAAQP